MLAYGQGNLFPVARTPAFQCRDGVTDIRAEDGIMSAKGQTRLAVTEL